MNKTFYIHLESVDSTNNWVKRFYYLLNKEALSCITADEQTAGRGQFARRWVSPKGENLYATLYFRVPCDAKHVQDFGKALSLSCVQLLHSKGINAAFYPPNDIFIDNKKCGGVLAEILQHKEGLGIVLGIGLNVNCKENTLNSIDQPATSLAMVSRKQWDIHVLKEELVQRFFARLQTLV